MMQLLQLATHFLEYLQYMRSFFSGNTALLILLIASSALKALTAKLKFDVVSLSDWCESVTS
jgi:hypothetical protein